jgi:hypothetical protein
MGPIASSPSTRVTERAQRPVLVVIVEDPRASHRANEALRIALGITAGENPVDIVLAGPAVHLLDEDTDDLVDGDDIAKFREALRGQGIRFHVDPGDRPRDLAWNAEGHAVVEADASGVAALASRADRVLVF